jgi:hypothetical protein
MGIIKDCWEVAKDIMEQTHNPDSLLHKTKRLLHQRVPRAWRRLTIIRSLRLKPRGKSFAIAFSAYLSLMFAIFALVIFAEGLGMMLLLISKPTLTAKQSLLMPFAGGFIGASFGWECKAYYRSMRVTARAWKKVNSCTRVLASLWFIFMALTVIFLPLLLRTD